VQAKSFAKFDFALKIICVLTTKKNLRFDRRVQLFIYERKMQTLQAVIQ